MKFEKFERSVLLLKTCLWAAVHSPYFRDCKLYLYRPLVEVEVTHTEYGCEFLRIQLGLNRPKLILYIPSQVRVAFAKATQVQGETIDTEVIDEDIDNIPF